MNLQTVKETIYTKEFQEVLTQTQSAKLKEMRQKSFEFFAANGFPTPQNEEWKYTNVAPYVGEHYAIYAAPNSLTAEEIGRHFFVESTDSTFVFINGKLSRELSTTDALEGKLVWLSMEDAFADGKTSVVLDEKFGTGVNSLTNAFTALNTALTTDGLFLHVPSEVQIDAPIHLLFISTEGAAAFPRVFVNAEKFSEMTFIENYVSLTEEHSFTAAVVEVFVADEAKVKHFRVQSENQKSFNYGSTYADVHRGSLYDSTNITLGAGLSRHDINVKFNVAGAEAYVDGLYMVGGAQHHDTHSLIQHAVPNCTSHQTYKGVLNDKSRGVFNGKVFVAVGASGTDGYQSNKNLLLSNDARVDTKPQLEIFNDDVKCSHGATVGQLEDEELFYLLSRGISQTLAKNLLTYGFAEEVINKIEIASIKKQLDEAVLNRLNTSLEF